MYKALSPGQWGCRAVMMLWLFTAALTVLSPTVAAETTYSVQLPVGSMAVSQSGAGPPLVLLHGFGASSFSWRHNTGALASSFTVYAVDLLGFGRSDSPTSDPRVYAHRAQAQTVLALMDKLQLESAVIIGHSMGGSIALHAALAAPERVEALVVIASPVSVSDRRNGGAAAVLLRLPLVRRIVGAVIRSRWAIRRMLHSAFYDPDQVTQEVVEGYRSPLLERDLPALLLTMNRAPTDPLLPQLAALTVPLYILWGEQDTWVSLSEAERLQAAVPHAELKVLPATGHLPHEEHPEQVNALLKAFLVSVGSP